MCAALLAAVLAGCSAGEGDEGGAGELRVYLSVPLHGPAAPNGRAIRDGAVLAMRAEGGRGTEDSHPLVLRTRDEVPGSGARARWSPATVAENARRATSDSGAIAYVGEFESGATRVSLPVTNEAAMAQISPASTAVDLVAPFPGSDDVPELVQPSGERSFGRVIPDDEAQAAAGARWARELGARRAFVVSDGSEFGEVVADEFAGEAEEIGISVEGPRPVAQSAPRAIRSAHPDVVYYGGTAASAFPLLPRAADAAPAATIMSTDALLLDRPFLARLGQIESQLRLTAAAQHPSQLPPQGQRFVRSFRRQFGRDPDPYAAYGYEAIALVVDLVQRAGGEAADRTTIVEELFSTRDRDSVLGTYSIDEVGNTTLARMAGYRVRGGRPVFAASLRAP